MSRAVLQRRIGVLVLMAYLATVALAAWRHEVRPAFFDRPVLLARAALASVGIRPGVAVFTTDAGTAPDAKIATSCLEVRVVEPGGRAHRIYPPGDQRCPAPPPRLRVSGEQIALSRWTTSLRAAVAGHRTGALDPSRARLPRLLAETIAAHFRLRARVAGLDPERFALLWTESRVSYASGGRSDSIVALFRWGDPSRPGVFVFWRPDGETLDAVWPALEEP